MKRKVFDDLIIWNKKLGSKPVLLTGAKGVGKTYLAYDFAKAFFEDIKYINLERETDIHPLFEASDINELKKNLYQYLNIKDKPSSKNSILILDEITFCPSAFAWLVPMLEHGIFHRIIAISSCNFSDCRRVDDGNSGIQLSGRNITEEPAFLHIHVTPLQFDEFLRAISKDWYIEAVMTHFESNKAIPEIVHKELMVFFELYLQIGGMPGIVNEYLNLSSYINVPEEQGIQLSAYRDTILKSYPESDALKMNQVLDSLALQLLKENRKFQYKLIRKGTTHAMYKDAIQYLANRSNVLECFKVSTDKLPMLSKEFLRKEELRKAAGTNFKLYYQDIGLFYSRIAGEQHNPSEPMARAALLESYVAQTLNSKDYPLLFWESDSMAKIDFLLPGVEGIVPVELHSSGNTRSKSISILKQKCNFTYAIKVSPKNFEFSNQVKYVPYYAVFCM